jgi:hypothetical protein
MSEPFPDPSLPERRIVAFVDILGFRAHVSSIFNDQKPNFALYATLRRVLSLVRGHAISASDSFVGRPTARGSAFSDCIAISDEPSEIGSTNVAWRVALLSAWLLGDGILCRGGIAIGRTLHDETTILGEGLVRAYELESRIAIYPRVVLSEEVASLATCWQPLARIHRDADGLAFLDPFYMLKKTPKREDFPHSPREPAEWDHARFQEVARHLSRLVAESKQAGASRADVLAKQQWLLNRLNIAASEYLGSSVEELLAEHRSGGDPPNTGPQADGSAAA